ncbi:MAG: CPBP family intramembrane metalloprotease, partial [Defluviitaleaceae bacterium]|nr:CPBP family intramembrane metalloprotease [Defluviitaleaceae bacterium]
ISVATLPVVFFLNFASMMVFTQEPAYIDLSRISPVWAHMIAAGLFAGVLEELWFRGALYREYRDRGVSVRNTAIVTGLFFGLWHLEPFQAVWAAAFGVMSVYQLHYTGSILAPILCHVLANALGVLFNPMFYVSHYTEFWELVPTVVTISGVASLLMLPVAVFCWRKLRASGHPIPGTYADEPKVFTAAYFVIIAIMLLLIMIGL